MAKSDPKFAFYEKMAVRTNDLGKLRLNGQLGAVLGITEMEDKLSWYYAVWIYAERKTWCFFEDELVATGEHAKREDFFTGESCRVAVDERGRGRVIQPPPEQNERH